jgi:hypothetical protein
MHVFTQHAWTTAARLIAYNRLARTFVLRRPLYQLGVPGAPALAETSLVSAAFETMTMVCSQHFKCVCHAGLCVKLFRQVARICGAGIDRNVEPQEAMDPTGAF